MNNGGGPDQSGLLGTSNEKTRKRDCGPSRGNPPLRETMVFAGGRKSEKEGEKKQKCGKNDGWRPQGRSKNNKVAGTETKKRKDP